MVPYLKKVKTTFINHDPLKWEYSTYFYLTRRYLLAILFSDYVIIHMLLSSQLSVSIEPYINLWKLGFYVNRGDYLKGHRYTSKDHEKRKLLILPTREIESKST